jgi:hypothetical protein
MNPSAGKIRNRALLAATLLLGSAGALAETAQLARDGTLLAQPLTNAAVVVSAKAGTTLTVESRDGAWAKVKTTDGKTGYVRLFNLRTSSGAQGDSGVGQLVNVFRTGASGTSVSTGVKGLSGDDLTGAKPDRKEVKKLDHFQVGEKEASQSAAAQGLKEQDVAWLPEPAKKNGKED